MVLFYLTKKRKEFIMEHVNKVNEMNRFGALAIIETFWAIGTSVAANSASFR
jgi:hypothetical protein